MTGSGHEQPLRVDALLPPEMAVRAEETGVKKASMDTVTTLMLALLAGAFIALGGVFSTVVLAGAGSAPWGIVQLLAGLVFSLGLILVLVGGAELFTGNNLIVMAWASRRIGTRALLRNWIIVYIGNFVGALATALLVYGGVLWMTSAGDKTKVETATKIIKNAVIGLIITVAAYAIASYVVGALVSVAG